MKLVELYFQDSTKPKGQRFLGAVLMEDNEQSQACFAKRAWDLGINPGGEVVFYNVNSESLTGFKETHLDRLLTEEEGLAINLFSKN